MVTAEFSKFAGVLSAALSQHHLLGFEIAYWNSMTSTSSTRDLFKKIRDTKGTFHAKMGSIKDRNGMDLTEAEYIKKRWQEYTEELYQKVFMTQITTMVCSLTESQTSGMRSQAALRKHHYKQS